MLCDEKVARLYCKRIFLAIDFNTGTAGGLVPRHDDSLAIVELRARQALKPNVSAQRRRLWH